MVHTDYPPGEIARRAKEIYERDIRSRVLEGNKGKRIVVDILSGDYELGEDGLENNERLRLRHPDGIFFGMRIGYRTADKIGGSWKDLEEGLTEAYARRAKPLSRWRFEIHL